MLTHCSISLSAATQDLVYAEEPSTIPFCVMSSNNITPLILINYPSGLA